MTRVQVSGGFLAGLDLPLSRGLNVIIGARGSGKTTLLELIRFALGAPSLTPEADQTDRQFVRQMLGDGEVVLDLAGVGDRPQRLVVNAESVPSPTLFDSQSLFLGQNGLEAVASSAKSRARLIDLQAGLRDMEPEDRLAALTRDIFDVRQTIRQMQEELKARPSLERDLELLEQGEAQWRGRSVEGAERIVAELQVAESGYRDAAFAHDRLRSVQVAGWAGAARARRSAGELETAEAQGLPDEVHSALRAAVEASHLLAGRIAQLSSLAQSRASSVASTLEILTSQIVRLRSELEELERGRGEASDKITHARLVLARLSDVERRLSTEAQKFTTLQARRQDAMAAREREQERRYHARRQVADRVSSAFEDRIQVVIDHLADSAAFRDMLSTLLQGSGLRYSSIAESLSQALLPQNLVALLESGAATDLAAISGISQDRAQRLLSALSERPSISRISEAVLEDAVHFFLRDGAAYKAMDQLSTGQKCATVLPLILMDRGRVLFLDQPEDHLDNAFLVSNVINSLSRRSASGAQTLVATHNPNIPVLGEAGVVCALGSDGVRARVQALGEFRDAGVVEAITNVMEGGAEAFRLRAEFYLQHGRPS